MEEKNLNLRVFRRNAQMLVLLWDKVYGDVEAKDIEILFREEGGKSKDFTRVTDFTLDLPSDMADFKSKQDTVICVIPQEKNRIEPNKDYMFSVQYGKLNQSKRVFGVGILPPREREDKTKNIHLYLWNDDKQKWQKAEGIEDEDGHFRMLINTGPMRMVKSKSKDV